MQTCAMNYLNQRIPQKKAVSEEVSVKSVGTNTDFVCTCYKSPKIILNIPGQLPLPVSPISKDESKAQ